jgi:tetratricopeptide (TPR) repeat protein
MPKLRALVVAAAALAAGDAVHGAERPTMLIRSQNLTVVGQQSAKTLRGIALQLEQFRVVVGGLINNAQRPLPVPAAVYVFGTHKEFEPFLPLYNGKPGSMGGYFFHDEDVYDIALQLEGFEEGAEVVFHEYTHLLLRNAARFIPLWLDEGLAEYYSTYALDSDGRRANVGKPLARHVLLLRERFVPLADLIRVDHGSPMYNERDRQSIFYAEAWALTHYLMNAMPEGQVALNRYATAVAKGAEPGAAFVDAFGKTPAAFEKELRTYIHGFSFVSRVFTFKDRLQVKLPDEGRELPPGEAEAWFGDLQRRAGRVDEAAARIDAAATAAPDSPRALLSKARLRLQQKRPAEAWPAFESAAALAPDDFSTQFAYAVALLRNEEDTGRDANDAAIERARAALVKATAANPTSSDAFAWLAYAEMLTDGRVKEAAVAIRRAMELAPGRLDYVLRYADVLMLAGSYGDARTVLTDVSRVTTDPRSAAAAMQRLAVLDEAEARMRDVAARAAAVAVERRAAADAVASQEAAAAEAARLDLEAARRLDAAEKNAPRPRLRAVQRGEERAYGDLVNLECGAAAVRVHLRVGSRLVVATARGIEDLTLTSFVAGTDFAITCGVRESPDAVYLTWRSAPHRTEGGATIVGQAVAIEFVPRGFTP